MQVRLRNSNNPNNKQYGHSRFCDIYSIIERFFFFNEIVADFLYLEPNKHMFTFAVTGILNVVLSQVCLRSINVQVHISHQQGELAVQISVNEPYGADLKPHVLSFTVTPIVSACWCFPGISIILCHC